MENEIKTGEYIRYKGNIRKIIDYNKEQKWYELDESIMGEYEPDIFLREKDIKVDLKHSFNIIDLIKNGDYVNGEPVEKIETGLDWGREITTTTEYLTNEEDIETIVTKEMMESISYKVEKED